MTIYEMLLNRKQIEIGLARFYEVECEVNGLTFPLRYPIQSTKKEMFISLREIVLKCSQII
jgi:hypothetical protein